MKAYPKIAGGSHRCEVCNEVIKKGQHYMKFRRKGEKLTKKAHPDCLKLT